MARRRRHRFRIVPPGDSVTTPNLLLVKRIVDYLNQYDGAAKGVIEHDVEGNTEAIRDALRWLADTQHGVGPNPAHRQHAPTPFDRRRKGRIPVTSPIAETKVVVTDLAHVDNGQRPGRPTPRPPRPYLAHTSPGTHLSLPRPPRPYIYWYGRGRDEQTTTSTTKK